VFIPSRSEVQDGIEYVDLKAHRLSLIKNNQKNLTKINQLLYIYTVYASNSYPTANGSISGYAKVVEAMVASEFVIEGQ